MSDSSLGTCPTCGKKRFVSRKAARQFARRKLPAERLNAYPCGAYWHLGHLPVQVVQGHVGRETL